MICYLYNDDNLFTMTISGHYSLQVLIKCYENSPTVRMLQQPSKASKAANNRVFINNVL